VLAGRHFDVLGYDFESIGLCPHHLERSVERAGLERLARANLPRNLTSPTVRCHAVRELYPLSFLYRFRVFLAMDAIQMCA
jgi:hypothetical protein